MKIFLAFLLATSGLASASLDGGVPLTDSVAPFQAGHWGLGLRPLGASTSILAYRTLAPKWTAMLRLSWSTSNSDHEMPSGQSTTVTTYDYSVTKDVSVTTATTSMDTETVTRSHSFTAILGPEYERALGRSVDFKAGVGLVASWSWSTSHQWITNGTMTSTSYVSNWALGGDARGLQVFAGGLFRIVLRSPASLSRA